MQRVKLDRVDRRILHDLQEDGRMTNVELSKRAGISAPPCLRRVRALEEAGFIKGYRGLLDEKPLGFEVTVFAMVHLSSQAEADLVAFENAIEVFRFHHPETPPALVSDIVAEWIDSAVHAEPERLN